MVNDLSGYHTHGCMHCTLAKDNFVSNKLINIYRIDNADDYINFLTIQLPGQG